MAKNDPDFGQVFQDLLLSKDFSDAMLAERLGKDRSTVYRWHNEGRAPDPATLREVAECLRLNDQEKRRLFEAAGYLVVFTPTGSVQEEPPPSPPPPIQAKEEKPRPDIQDNPLLSVKEPKIVPFALADSLATHHPEYRRFRNDIGRVLYEGSPLARTLDLIFLSLLVAAIIFVVLWYVIPMYLSTVR